jgi:hypothetical protein
MRDREMSNRDVRITPAYQHPAGAIRPLLAGDKPLMVLNKAARSIDIAIPGGYVIL